MKILSVEDTHGIFIRPGEPLDPGRPLLQLRDVIENSPAWLSGIMKPGDVFLKINDEETRTMSHPEIKEALVNTPVGALVKFVMSRAILPKDSNHSLSTEAFTKADMRIRKLIKPLTDFGQNFIKTESETKLCSEKNGFKSKNGTIKTNNMTISHEKQIDFIDEKPGKSSSAFFINRVTC
ncbi:hypothetical protein RF11_12737 [Thelohanellus kitauei]|uniref:PDZ domain-containing protein n=1 Tax=Thelohanellus kitauei TaxID=669202 RepID=A0A0C2MJU5_THEKT|nr:hypothetical protein RF11_12737 [Thelohanellus kitauei]